MTSPKGYALITGASKGIGKEIAIALAAQGWSLLLVARSADLLTAMQTDLATRYKVPVVTFAADLSLPEVPGQLLALCQEKGLAIRILVNNAGYGVWDKFEQADLAEIEGMNALNVIALVRMCHVFIPLLRQHPRSYLLNVSSLGAYQPLPFMANYGAGKAYVRSFSYALRSELRNSPISVTCLSPGGVRTAFPDRAKSHAVAERNDRYTMDADRCARITLKAMFKGRAEVIPGWYNVLAMFFTKLLPTTLTASMAGKIMAKPD